VVADIITWSGLTRRQDFQAYISFKYIHFFQSLTIAFKTTPKYATRHDGDQINFVRFEVLMSLAKNNTVSWDVMSCGLVERYQYFGGTFRLTSSVYTTEESSCLIRNPH